MENLDEIMLSYIPQRTPFVMVDEIRYSDESITISKFHIKLDNIFVENGFFKEPGLIENIAQTAAAREGLISKKENTQVRMGYIGSIKNLIITDFPKINDEIITRIKIDNQIFQVILITGEIVCDEKIIAQCEMKIFIS